MASTLGFWAARGFSDESIERFGLGDGPAGGTIAMRSRRGHLLGSIGVRDDVAGPAYDYPAHITDHLYGAWLIRKRHRKAALVQGPLDAIACWEARVPALALMGEEITSSQFAVIQHLNISHVVLMTDNTTQGRDTAVRVKDTVVGLEVSTGIYRPYWRVRGPRDLNPQRLRKMFHSASPPLYCA